jgi:hypothetical protein
LCDAQQVVNHRAEFVVGPVRQKLPAAHCWQACVPDFG